MIIKSVGDDSGSPPAIVSLLKGCAENKNLDRGRELHADVARSGLFESNLFVGNAVINFYAKCGLLVLAFEVFNYLPKRDVVSWNVLIAGYAQYGLGQEALNCFGKMKCQGFRPNVVTYLSVLKAVVNIGDAEQGEEICGQISRNNLLNTDVTVGNALIDMYSNFGLISKAQHIFDKLPARTVVSWNALIKGYAQHGNGQTLFNSLMQMQLEGLPMDSVTFLCSLNACGLLGTIDVGLWIHAEIARKGFLHKNLEVFNALVDMYARCSALCKAKEVFEALQFRNTVSWNSLIGGFVEHGFGEEALNFYEQMQNAGFAPNSVTLLCLLKACILIGTAYHGHIIHAHAVKVGLHEKDSVLGTAFVDMYAKCDGMQAAQIMFDKLAIRTRASWNVLITGYQQVRQSGLAISCFELMCKEGHSPDAITFLAILKACGDLGAADRGAHLSAEINKSNLSAEGHMILANALIEMYAKCGLLLKAKEVFDDIPVKSIFSWNALIAAYADYGLGHETLTCFEQMQHNGIYPNEVTFVYLLKACGSVHDCEKGQQMHDWVVRLDLLKNDSVIATALLNMYFDFGMILHAEIVSDMSVRDEVLWNALISAYVGYSHSDKAFRCYEQMREEGFFPNSVTFVVILKACASIGSAHKGRKIHAEIIGMGSLEKETMIGTALVSMYAAFCMIDRAQAIFDRLPIQDGVLYSEIIKGYAQLGDDKSVLNLYRSMVLNGEEPDAVIFMVLLSTCSHAGLIDEGQMYLEVMSTVHGVTPIFEHHTCMLDSFGRAGALEKAVSVIFDMPFHADLAVWNSMLGACQKHYHMEFGMVAFVHAMELNEKEVLPVLSMKNIYASALMQSDADEI